MKKPELEAFIEITGKIEFEKYFKTNGYAATREHFGLSHDNMTHLKRLWEICFSAADNAALRRKTWGR